MGERSIVRGFKGVGGKHCETCSLKKVLDFYDLSFSEEFLFGMGGGAGFIYWYMKKMKFPFVGGHMGKVLEVPMKACKRLGIGLEETTTASPKKGYERLKEILSGGAPAMVYGDMVYLPYFALPEVAHFGGHLFVVYGLDEDNDEAYISDRAKKLLTVSLEDLARARGSQHPPFPPKHRVVQVAVPSKLSGPEDGIKESIRECVDAMLDPPIKNFGLAGMKKWADLVVKWPEQFKGMDLVGCLMNGFIYIEISGTGGSAFRPMYAKFLDEAENMLGQPGIKDGARELRRAGKVWSDIAVSFLPDSWPNLAKIRKLMLEKDRIFIEQKQGALEAMSKINERMEGCFAKAVCDLRKPVDFLEETRGKILELRDIEAQAFGALKEVADRW